MKIAAGAKVIAEVANYRLYVHDNLPPVIGYIRQWNCFWGLGAIRYVFAGKGGTAFLSIESLCERALGGDAAALERVNNVFTDFFIAVWVQDSSKGDSQTGPSGYSYLLNPDKKETWQTALEQCHKTLLKRYRAAWAWDAASGALSIGGQSVAWPTEAVNSCEFREVTRLTHGDLHGANLIADGNNAWVLDFERSGKGPQARDVAEMEMCILTDYWKEDDDAVALKRFIDLYNGVYDDDPLGKMVAHLRSCAGVAARDDQRADRLNPVVDISWTEFLMGVYAHCVFMAARIGSKGKIIDDLRLRRCLLLAAVCGQHLIVLRTGRK
jgi:hypothetical protein